MKFNSNVILLVICAFLFTVSCGSSGGGGNAGGETGGGDNGGGSDSDNVNEDPMHISVPVNTSVTVKGGESTTVISGSYGMINVVKLKSLGIDLMETLKSVSVTIPPGSSATTSQHSAQTSTASLLFIRIAGEAGAGTVCQDGTLYGPFTVMNNEQSQPASVQPEKASLNPSEVGIINTGSFAMCIQVESPLDAVINVNNVAVEMSICEEAPADIVGTWTGTYSCTNFGTGNDGGPIALTISQNKDGSYHYEDGSAVYNGHLCGNVFKFNGGVSGLYTESGTFVLNSDGTASKTSTWNSIPPGVTGGNCTDALHKYVVE
ncbi:MAG: hypothetical protein HZC49_03635 [Nitrospirae bacterium]|nr:hypothetical protein [Nitrospirota bacterium]